MSQYDLRDISFLIHVRLDVDERLENLTAVMDYYHEHCINVEFVIVNDDTEPDKRLKSLHEKYGDTSRFLFQQNKDIYHRTRAFNVGSTSTDRPYIIAGDTDVIVHPKHILKSVQILKSDDKIAAVFPYNGLFIELNDKLKQQLIETRDTSSLYEFIPPADKHAPEYKDDNITIIHDKSKGGCIVYSHKHWNTFNGYNPNFIGWGLEDDEIAHRIYVLGYYVVRVDDKEAVAWHLSHPNTMRKDNPHFDNNEKLCNFVGGILDKPSMTAYIQSWKL